MTREEQEKNYRLAMEYKELDGAIDDDYREAAELFELAGDYEDAAQKRLECLSLAENYRQKRAAESRKNRRRSRLLAVLAVILTVLGASAVDAAGDIRCLVLAHKAAAVRDFAQANEQVQQLESGFVGVLYAHRYCYELAERAGSYGEWEISSACYRKLGSYRDSEEKYLASMYALGESYLAENRYQMAYQTFTDITDHRDSAQKLAAIPAQCYAYAESCYAAGDLKTARNCFDHKCMKYYRDSSVRAYKISYEYGCQLLADGQYEQAEDAFNRAQNIDDTALKLNEVHYAWAKALIEQGDTEEAVRLLGGLKHYRDSFELKCRCNYALADSLEKDGRTDEAYKLFTELGDYADSAERAAKCR